MRAEGGRSGTHWNRDAVLKLASGAAYMSKEVTKFCQVVDKSGLRTSAAAAAAAAAAASCECMSCCRPWGPLADVALILMLLGAQAAACACSFTRTRRMHTRRSAAAMACATTPPSSLAEMHEAK